MSRYLGEITNQRQHSYAVWRTNQLERRPAPVSGLLFPWAMLRDGVVSVTAGTEFPVDFDVATKNDPNDEFFTWSTTDSGDSGNFRFVLTLKKQGIYLIDLVGSWQNTGSGGDGTATLDLNPSNSYNPFAVSDEKFVSDIGGDWISTTGSGDLQASPDQRVFCLYSANTNCQLAPTVFLTSVTGTKDFETSYLKAVYLEDHGPTADWTVDYIPGGS